MSAYLFDDRLVLARASDTLGCQCLHLNDRLVLTTDGLLEARDSEGNMLEDAGFDALLGAVGNVDAAQTARRLAWAVRTREGDNPHDDLTVVVVRRVEGEQNDENEAGADHDD